MSSTISDTRIIIELIFNEFESTNKKVFILTIKFSLRVFDSEGWKFSVGNFIIFICCTCDFFRVKFNCNEFKTNKLELSEIKISY